MIKIIKKKEAVGWLFLIFSVLITVFIFFNSSRDAVTSSQSSKGLARIFMDVTSRLGINADYDTSVHIVRKSAHFTEFACQAAGLSLFVIFTGRSIYGRLIYIFFTGLITACIDELIQLFPQGRSSQVSDVFVDFSGTVFAVCLCVVFYIVYIRRRCGNG